MGADNISVVLDSPTNSFYAGTTVSGRVVVKLDSPMKVRSLCLKLLGKAQVSWSESESHTVTRTNAEGGTENATESQNVTYSADEEYFSNKYNLLGEIEIPAGENVYPFSSPLPPVLPSSFSGDYGDIKYTVKATLDRPWKFDIDSKLEFKVVAPMDLNYNVVAKEPVKKEAEKHFCCWCCRSGPLSMVLCLPHSGFVPGQPFSLNLDVDNASNIQVEEIVISLKKTILWKVHRPSSREKTSTTELVKTTLEGVAPRGSKSTNQQVCFPADMPVINVDACSIIKMSHCLEVVCKVGSCHANLSMEVPLIVGSVPIGYGGGEPYGAPASAPSDPSPQVPTIGFNLPVQSPYPVQQ